MTQITQKVAIVEARRIINHAKKMRLTLRVFGGVGIYIHCLDRAIPLELEREYVDLDFVGLSREVASIKIFFENIGYKPLQRFNTIMGSDRLLFVSEGEIDHIDVIIDKLRMCHVIDLESRLDIDDATIPVVDLLLSKLQIVNITEKDLKDIIMLLLCHDIGESDNNEVNLNYFDHLISKDWGLWKTVTINISKLLDFIQTISLANDYVSDVTEKLNNLMDSADNIEKSLKWKLRSLVGERVKWYELPGEVKN